MIRPVPWVADQRAYAVPRPAGPIDLRLDGNEGFAPPAGLLRTLTSGGLLREYPSPRRLEALLAERHGVSADHVLVTAGADDALERACRALLAPGRSLVLPSPTFEMVDRYATFTGATVIRPRWRRDWPLEAVLGARDADVIALVSPNNPTGAVVTPDQLGQVVDAHPQAALLVDHAYIEFADPGDDLTSRALELPQALVFRTLSKAWGLAGLRVGYVVGNPETIGWLRCVGQPYAVSGPSLALAEAALSSLEDEVHAFVRHIRAARATVIEALQRAGFAPLPSRANFVYVPEAPGLWRGLGSRGIAVRAWPTDPQRPTAVRITVPDHHTDLKRLCAAIAEIRSSP